jgi:heme-degrading monooxygenase HmoA
MPQIADSYMSVALCDPETSQPKELPMRFVMLSAFAAAIAFAPADHARGQAADGRVMEVVTFRLIKGVTDAAFLAAARGTETIVAAQPGFISRRLLRDDTGQWTDTVEWQSLAAAHAAAETVVSDPAFAAFGGSIDMTGLTMRHVPILWQMGD